MVMEKRTSIVQLVLIAELEVACCKCSPSLDHK